MVSPPRGSPQLSSASSSRQESENKDDEVIDLCSDDDSNLTSSPQLENEFGSDMDGDDDEDEEDSELKLVEQLREVQNSLNLKLKMLERQVKNRKSQKELEPNGETNQQPALQQEPSCSGGNVQVPIVPLSSSFLKADPTRETKVEQELKRKLDMVTAELSRSRMTQVKKIKRETAREMVIEVLEFPKEYYNKAAEVYIMKDHHGEPEDWFRRFNWHLKFHKEPEYREWVETRTIEFLPEVLKIMTTPCNKSASTTVLNGSDLLNFRLVCKSWKRSVDKLIQEPCLDGGLPLVSTNLRSSDHAKVGNLALNVDNNSSDVLKPHPFPSRSLIVNTNRLDDAKDTEIFNFGIDILLHVYGKGIQHFGYHGIGDVTPKFFDAAAPDFLNSWRTLRGWLIKMPNLTTLQIYLPSVAYEQGTSEVATNPFPSFPKLVVFKCRHIPNFLLESAFSHNKAVEKLTCVQRSGEHPKWVETDYQLVKLSEFSMNVVKMSDILPLGQVNWPLRKLSLSTVHSHEELIDIGLLFITLESFQKTLQELNLRLWIARCREKVHLELPHLKKLDIFLVEDSKDEKISYDFLLPLNQLEMLRLVFEREMDKTGEVVQVIQLQGYLNRLYESNIWTLFPCLKKVEATASVDGRAKVFRYSRDKVQI